MKGLVLTACLLCPLLSHACLFAPGYARFKPAVGSFAARTNRGQVALLPAPQVSAIHVARGTASPGASCEDAGSLSLELDWPTSSPYKLQEVGFYFRVLGGREPDQIFPLEPVTGTIAGQRARFVFIWLDGHPSRQTPLNLDVEVFAVNKGLEIGKSRRFRVTDTTR